MRPGETAGRKIGNAPRADFHHYHSGIAWHHPVDVHYGCAQLVQAARTDVLAAAYERHLERFVRKHPQPRALPEAAWINKPPSQDRPQDGDPTHSKIS